MARASWDKFLPLLAPHVPGAPEVSMRLALASSAADFLGRTHLWRVQLDPQDTIPGEADHELFADAIIETPLWVRLDGVEITPTDVRDAPSLPASPGRPTHYWRVTDTTIRLYPTPDAAYSLDALVVLKPSRAAAGVEDWIYETWADALVDGAIWHLARIPGKDWTDVEMAQVHKARFDRAVSNARVRDVRQIDRRVRFQVR